ncbi:MAG: acetolactate synthase [Polyangiaceae bacterium]|nr:acetolactate synthase [Polyangiaceae bacterium]
MTLVHGGRLVAQALKRHGITHTFTLCGGHIQAIYDGCLDEGIRVVDVRHEQTAGHAADGWARVTGIPGVALVTAGPGITDVVTALATAQRTGVPMLCIGGAGPAALQDMGSLQDMDTVTLMRPISKWSARVPEVGRVKEYIDSALRIAQSNVPGPVYLEMPLDLLMNYAEDSDPLTAPLAPPRPAGDPDAIERAAALLRAAERPTFIVGAQLRWARDREILRKLAEKVRVPYFLNGMARGALPHAHPCLFSRSRRQALAESDLVLVFGTPFDFRVEYGRPGTWNPDGKVVQVDLDGAELGRNRRIDVAIHGDSGLVLAQLLDAVGSKEAPAWVSTLRASEQRARDKMAAEIAQSSDPPNPLRVCHELGQRLGKNDVVVGDGGDFVATAAYTIPLEWPQLWMDPGPLGTLGIGPGFAMAAQLARPDARAVLVYGDGSFGLHAMEFEAMARQKLPVVAVIGNDAAWTQIRRGQVTMYGEERAVATSLTHTRYEQVVEACGGKGFWVEKLSELGPALDAAFGAGVPACVNVKIAGSEFRKNAISV